MAIRFDPASLANADAPGTLLASSRAGGWTSLLLHHFQEDGVGDAFDDTVTPDQKIVVTLRGSAVLEVFAGGRWRRGLCLPASVGLSFGGQANRLRVSHANPGASSRTAHLYLPTAYLLDAADHYRRIGQRTDGAPLTALSYLDKTVATLVAGMLAAMRAGAPDFYAEAAARFLAAHLLAEHSGWRIDIGEDRSAGVLTDARLARVVDYMSANIAAPITLAGLAAEAGISVHHFGKLFRKATGVSPLRYLGDMRMECARRLLATTDIPVQQVARHCGFASVPSFSQMFRDRQGIAPTEFRRARHHRAGHAGKPARP